MFRDERQARGHDDEACRIALAIAGRDAPALGPLVPVGGLDPRLELDVPEQIEALGNVVQIAQDLRLGRVALGPVPLLLERFRELIGVLHALHIAARPGVAIPVPGTADAGGGLEDLDRETELSQAMEHVEPGEAGSDDHGVEADFVVLLRSGVQIGHGEGVRAGVIG